MTVSSLDLPSGPLALPAFLPDATRGVVRSLDPADLAACGVRAVVMNAFHLMRRPGVSTARALGGLHRMSGWNGAIVTDSGGFQAYSLIRQDPKQGSITAKGLVFRRGGQGKLLLTPEKSVETQVRLGADAVVCLDDCTHADDPPEAQEASVERTVAWARRGREAFDRALAGRKDGGRRPLLFAVIQGGASPSLRRRCAESLRELGFDGYGFGGWPLDGKGRLLTEVLEATRAAVPPDKPLFALGVGHPVHVAACARMGYDLFDSSLPTRDARRGRLYDFAGRGAPGDGEKWVSFVYIDDEGHRRADAPVSGSCDCAACKNHSRGYLHHLYRIREGLYFRLATIHNLRFMAQLMERLTGAPAAGGGAEGCTKSH
ncbi:MAG: queuine tRNA-ribosyltransferase family protein [Planctomycetes bacterium]|jgi:queuine tRNA-ribosyltransferase|nr:queuine tRNA-ribosyltransferase family protein [Planctomycetota bacterium]